MKEENFYKIFKENAIYRCESLTKIEMPQSLISLCENAFGKCSSLKNIELPQLLEFIGYGAFSAKLSIPDNIDMEDLGINSEYIKKKVSNII